MTEESSLKSAEPASVNKFANDGSFMELFRKLQQNNQEQPFLVKKNDNKSLSSPKSEEKVSTETETKIVPSKPLPVSD